MCLDQIDEKRWRDENSNHVIKWTQVTPVTGLFKASPNERLREQSFRLYCREKMNSISYYLPISHCCLSIQRLCVWELVSILNFNSKCSVFTPNIWTPISFVPNNRLTCGDGRLIWLACCMIAVAIVVVVVIYIITLDHLNWGDESKEFHFSCPIGWQESGYLSACTSCRLKKREIDWN